MLSLKRHWKICLLIASTLLVSVSCHQRIKGESYSFVSSSVPFGENDYKKITSSNNAIGFDLLEKIEPNEDGNIFISPTSLVMALSMVYNGAVEDTKEEMAKTLYIDGIDPDVLNQANASLGTKLYKDTDKISLNIANSIWLNEEYQFDDAFSQKNKDYYRASVKKINPTDHASVNQINDWVKRETNQKIDQMVNGPLDKNFVALLMNAIYFNGEWKYAFESEEEKGYFHLQDGDTKKVNRMKLEEELLYLENDLFQAVKLPYGDEEMSMEIFLPKDNYSVYELKKLFSVHDWEEYQSTFMKKEGTVILSPFKVSYESFLNQLLIEKGMEKAFQPGKANFAKMIQEDREIYIDEVKQKTFIEVNEKGTEAAAATSVEMKAVSAPIDGPFYMDVNRPFLFTIKDEETNTILFIGVIANPTIEG